MCEFLLPGEFSPVNTCRSLRVCAGLLRTYRCSGGKSTTAWRTQPTASTATTWWADIPHSRVLPSCRQILHLPSLLHSLPPLSASASLPPWARMPRDHLLTPIHDVRDCWLTSANKTPPPPPTIPSSSFFDISIYKYIQIYFKASLRWSDSSWRGRGCMLKHSKSLPEEGEGAVGVKGGEGGWGWGRGWLLVNVVIRFCLPCIEKHSKNQVYIFFRNILNNVYNDWI